MTVLTNGTDSFLLTAHWQLLPAATTPSLTPVSKFRPYVNMAFSLNYHQVAPIAPALLTHSGPQSCLHAKTFDRSYIRDPFTLLPLPSPTPFTTHLEISHLLSTLQIAPHPPLKHRPRLIQHLSP